MLIVGTRGRSLGGFQGLVTQRNSFSKWCLQYSPIPVVVVRPTAKREKKKLKRSNDPSRQSYIQILQESGQGMHEANSSPRNSIYGAFGSGLEGIEILPGMGPDQEASAVAAALGLPAKFDPTIKPFHQEVNHLGRVRSAGQKSDATEESRESNSVEGSPDGEGSRPSSPGMVMKSPNSALLESPDGSDIEGDSDEEAEFEAVDARALLSNTIEGQRDEGEVKKEKLHAMEMDEAKALAGRKGSVASVESSASAGDE
jgi:hypothetical protein